MKADDLLLRIEPYLNPILAKEVRGTVREMRFVIIHLIMLLVAGVASIIVFLDLGATYSDSPQAYDPASAGREIYRVMQVLQIVILFLVAPGLASTLISSEKDRNTFEILLSSAVSPMQILMGKLLASLSVLGLMFVSLMPLVVLTFLFGGVEIGHVLRFYIFLGMLAALVAMFSICLSSVSRSSQQSVIGSYAGSVLLGIGLLMLFELMEDLDVDRYGLTVLGFVQADYEFPGLLSSRREVLAGLIFPVYCWTAIVALCFIAAFNGLKPPFANRATALRIYYLLTTCAGILLLATLIRLDAPDRPDPTPVGILLIFPICFSAFFIFDDLVPPVHARSRVSKLYPLRIFAPGAYNALLFCVVANMAVAALFAGAFERVGSNFAVPCAAALFAWAVFTAGFAVLLRGLLDDLFMMRFIFIIVLALAMILPTLVHSFVFRYSEPNPFSALSPFVTVSNLLDGETQWASLFVPVYGGVGAVCLLWGAMVVRRKIASVSA